MQEGSGLDLLVIAASNGENLKLAHHFAAVARHHGQSASVLDLTALPLPLFTPQAKEGQQPEAVARLEQDLSSAKRWVICAPEYNGGLPPVLTNAIAWLSVQGSEFRSLFNGRPVVIATHSGGSGHAMMAGLRLQLAYLGAQVVGRQLVCTKHNPAKEETLADLIQRLLTIGLPPS